ncbi:MAG: hypothetical protein ACI88G_001974, partial [Woeseiaceae bacterium]
SLLVLSFSLMPDVQEVKIQSHAKVAPTRGFLMALVYERSAV